MTYKNNFVVVFPDDFNRVILPVKRGQEFTDYINASFIDVSSILSLLSLTH
jgi:receptor-type tyrosine-protein phosphatase epsilon